MVGMDKTALASRLDFNRFNITISDKVHEFPPFLSPP
jgi:hypothetical protein